MSANSTVKLVKLQQQANVKKAKSFSSRSKPISKKPSKPKTPKQPEKKESVSAETTSCDYCNKLVKPIQNITIIGFEDLIDRHVHMTCYIKWLKNNSQYKEIHSTYEIIHTVKKVDTDNEMEKETDRDDKIDGENEDGEDEDGEDDEKDEKEGETESESDSDTEDKEQGEKKEPKKCYVVTFHGQFNSDSVQYGIFPNECKIPIICHDVKTAQQVKQTMLNKYLDKFYCKLVAGKDKMDFETKVKLDHGAWSDTEKYTFKYKRIPGVFYSPSFGTKQQVKDFVKLLTYIKNGIQIPDKDWIRQVCQSYLELKMRIIQGSFAYGTSA